MNTNLIPSEGWNRRYWKRVDDKGRNPIPWLLIEDILKALDTLPKLTKEMSRIKYTHDTLFNWKWLEKLPFATGHHIQSPVTTVHRRRGDCDDYAMLWYDRLTAMEYEAIPYLLYKRWMWIDWPWHFVVVWRSDFQLSSTKSYVRWFVASNSKHDMISLRYHKNDAIEDYREMYDYSNVRELTAEEIGRTG